MYYLTKQCCFSLIELIIDKLFKRKLICLNIFNSILPFLLILCFNNCQEKLFFKDFNDNNLNKFI